jgi:hypothetical protein
MSHPPATRAGRRNIARAAEKNTRSRVIVPAAVFALLMAPRIIRLAHPQVWIEDESYLTGALMLSHGFYPYRDFPLPHYPILEAFLASVFHLAHASIRAAEITTQIAAFAGSLLVFALGRRLDGVLTGAIAAIIFATSGLLFRYHVFEREVFVVVPVLAAVWLASRAGGESGRGTGRQTCAIGLLLFVALTIKLTAVAGLVAVALQLWYQRGLRAAAHATGFAVALLAALTIALVAIFGAEFVVQVFLFRAAHAMFPSLGVKLTEMRLTMDISLALGLAGLALIIWTDRARRWAGPLLQLAVGFVVLVLLNATYWPHTGIELLPWLSLTSGFLVASTVRAAQSSRVPGGGHVPPTKAFACAVMAVVLLVFVAPVHNLNWEAGDDSVYGFGYRDRNELEAAGAYIRAHTDSQALVATPPIIAFVADRREAIPYPEIAGTVEQLTDAVHRRGYLAAVSDPALRNDSFWDSLEASRARIAPQITAALSARRIAALVNDSPDDLMPVPFINVSQAALEASGYQLESAFAHYDVWLRR